MLIYVSLSGEMFNAHLLFRINKYNHYVYNVSLTLTYSLFKPPDVEEVEPYASYIQRVNSIYNSSAELFNAWEAEHTDALRDDMRFRKSETC